jgi:hypothetical protein
VHIRTFRSKKLNPEHVKLLNEAIRHNARGKEKDVHITYRKENGEVSERKVRPLAVKGKSLFVAHCHNRDDIRSFRVERIKMIKSAFWDGFEKRAYNYEHESKELGKHYDSLSKETPYSKTKAGLIGAGIGGTLGAGIGAFKGLPRSAGAGALIGGGIGAVGGGLMGVVSAIANKMGIEKAKEIVKMPVKERKEYLRHLARQHEISAQDAKEWSRDFGREMSDERRHRETLSALHREY